MYFYDQNAVVKYVNSGVPTKKNKKTDNLDSNSVADKKNIIFPNKNKSLSKQGKNSHNFSPTYKAKQIQSLNNLQLIHEDIKKSEKEPLKVFTNSQLEK